MKWVWIVVAWILLNVVVKLFVNSLERVLKDKIDLVVRRSPIFLLLALVEILRYISIIWFLPAIIVIELLPRRVVDFLGLNLLKESLFSRKRFYKAVSLVPYVLRHPLLLFRVNPVPKRIDHK